MNRIRLLPEPVANQIAAGEVIERPASVVKELVENALDAQAARVVVEIQAGGRSLIRVVDDGLGMSRDDALLCLERHATSKIRRAEDLAAITTMGFRGEALPSIASVSRFTLTTREREPDVVEGTRVVISGGKIIEVKAAGAAPGTSVEVRHLFLNLPARRKFLRSEETESAHIQHYLTLAALSFPEVSFTFQKEGRTVWQLPAVRLGTEPGAQTAALRERLRALYGAEQKLLALDLSADFPSAPQAETDSGGFDSALGGPQPDLEPARGAPRPSLIRLWGFIGAPGISRATREDQHVFVNRRPIENRGLNFALLEGYHTSLMKGRYPVCCLFLEIDPAAVDVNIHPAKREVRFHHEAQVRKFVANAIRQTLLDYHSRKDSLQFTVRSAQSPVQSPQPMVHGVETPVPVPLGAPTRGAEQAGLPNLPAALVPRALEPAPCATEQRALHMGFGSSKPLAGTEHGVRTTQTTSSDRGDKTRIPGYASQPQPVSAPATPVPLLSVPLRMVGVIGKLYVVLESDRGLVLLDQHAAHERILFEQMLNRLEQREQAPSQKLLLPETVELSARDSSFAREQLPILTRLGVGLSEFGERTFLLDALPPFVKATDARRFVLGLIDELKAAGQEVNTLRLGELTVAKTVCRHAVKANDPLAGPELEKLIEDLRHCAMPYTCPHGRPTLIEMNFRELEKKFGRSQ